MTADFNLLVIVDAKQGLLIDKLVPETLLVRIYRVKLFIVLVVALMIVQIDLPLNCKV